MALKMNNNKVSGKSTLNLSHFMLVILALGLSGCAYTPAKAINDTQPSYTSEMPDHFTLLSLGRSISDGRVDIYDPSAVTFHNMPMPPRKPDGFSQGSFLSHGRYKPMDKDVRVYAMTMPADDLEILDMAPVPAPVPLQ